jgi:dTDP-glucose 4,6-dehydratase
VILVTGGAGFIGGNFVLDWLKDPKAEGIINVDKLTYAGNLATLDSVKSDPRHIFVHGDIGDQELVTKLLKEHQPRAIVNFAAESHNDNSLKAPRDFVDTNVLGTLTLIQSALRYQKRFHQVSTDEVFGDLPFESAEKFEAASPYRPSSPYSASKAAADHLVRAWVRSFGLQATISNCSNNYGKRQHAEKLIPSTIKLALAGERPKLYGSGNNVRDWIHVNDHIDGIWEVLGQGVIGGTYLFGGDQELSNLEVVKIVLNAVGLAEDHFEFVPDRPGHDLRYAIDNTESSRKLGWTPNAPRLSDYVSELVEFYR